MNIFKRLYRALCDIFTDIAEGNITEDEFNTVFWIVCTIFGFVLVLLYVNVGITSQSIGVM
jgi:hypothetical protein